jgi:hypothetical protein
MRHYLICLILLAAVCSATGTSRDKMLLDRGYSYAPTENGKAQVYQVVALLERAVQQNDLSLLSLLAFSDSGVVAKATSRADFENRVSQRFAAEKTTGAASVAASGWKLSAFRNFRFLIDSVSITGDSASVNMRSTWTNAGNSEPPDYDFMVRLKRDGVRWYFNSPDQLLQLLDQYLKTECDLNSPESAAQRRERAASASSSSSFTRYSTLLFRPVPWSTTYSIPRATWSQSRQHLSGQKLFGCVSSVSSYVYLDAADFASDMIAASDECWRRIVVVDDHPDHSYIVSKGYHGTGATADEFLAPRGMEFCGPGLLYITEDANNRIKILLVSTQSNDHLDLFKFITMSQFNHPQDLDVSLPNQYSYKRTVVVANTGGNNILAFTDEEPLGHGAVTVQSGIGTTVGAFNRPTSIAFGRDPLTSEKTYWCYFIDSGNKRVVKIGSVFNAPSNNSYEAYDDFPDPLTDLSGIGVDNKGEVWVVDRGLGRIYKFTSSLVPIATHGMTGTADGEYLHPTSISFTEGYEYGVGPIANLGEVVLGEEWGEDTGIRRLVSGTEIFDAHLYCYPKLSDGTPARLSGDYFITGYSNLTEQYIAPNGITYTNTFNMRASGLEPFNFTLPAGSPSGTYRVKITAQSIYQNSNTDSITLSISVDASAVNQLPVVTCIYFPNGDTCFQPDIGQPISAIAHDADGSIANYFWSCDPANAGDFSNPYANPTYLTVYPSSGKLINERFVRVRVTDNYGQYSTYRSVNIGQCPITRCSCDACGDANSDGSVDISDVVFLIAHIFSGGAAPAECNYAKGKGDANGDGSVDISDVVYLIARIFSGGRPPYCQVK